MPPKLGTKFDTGKPRRSLVPLRALWSIVEVLEYGAQKYAPNNWRHVDNARTRYYDAMHRHIDAWWGGEQDDPESGLHHLAHAGCCLFYLLAFDLEDTDED